MKFFLLRRSLDQLSRRSAPVFPIAGSDSDLARAQSADSNKLDCKSILLSTWSQSASFSRMSVFPRCGT